MRAGIVNVFKSLKPRLRNFQAQIAKKELAVPHPTQLSRARVKLDMLMMKLKQQQWASARRNCDTGFFIMLSVDASPIQGTDAWS